MTRRPILIGVAAVLALALTTGLAYGTGRMWGTQPRNSHSARDQRIGTTNVVPGYVWNHRGQGSHVWRYGPAFRGQMRDWMQAWMRDHNRDGRSWTGTRYGRQGSGSTGGYPTGTHDGYGPDQHMTRTRAMGNGTGGRWRGSCRASARETSASSARTVRTCGDGTATR